MGRGGEFFAWLWGGMVDEWESASRLARAEVVSVGVMLLYSAIYIPLYLNFRIISHPPFPHPMTLAQDAADLAYGWQLSPLQFLAGLGWNLVVLVATVLFLTYCASRVRSGIRSVVRRRRDARRWGPIATYGGEERVIEVEADVWEQALRDAGIDEL